MPLYTVHGLIASILSAQLCLPKTITQMLEDIEVQTGMVGTVLLGGPEPRLGGKIVCMRYAASGLSC